MMLTWLRAQYNGSFSKGCAAVLAAVVAGLAMGSCSDSGGNSPTMPTTPTRAVIASDEFWINDSDGSMPFPRSGGVALDPCSGIVLVPFRTGEPGTLDVTVRWGADRNDLDVGVVRGTQPGACSCRLFLETTVCESNAAGGLGVGFSASGNKPEQLTIPNLDPGDFLLLIWNNGDYPDTGAYEIGLTN